MTRLPFTCKQCGGAGDADVKALMGVKMTCEYCGATVSPPVYDVGIEPPDGAILPMVMATVQKLLGVGLADALKIVKETRVIGTKVPAEVADRQRTTLEGVGAKVTVVAK